jgi:hypothetical protein
MSDRISVRVQFDILKRTEEGYVWLEGAQDLERAKERLRDLIAGSAGQYVIFDERTHLVVARVDCGVG